MSAEEWLGERRAERSIYWLEYSRLIVSLVRVVFFCFICVNRTIYPFVLLLILLGVVGRLCRGRVTRVAGQPWIEGPVLLSVHLRSLGSSPASPSDPKRKSKHHQFSALRLSTVSTGPSEKL